MKFLSTILACTATTLWLGAQDLKITDFQLGRALSWTGAYSKGVCTIETAPNPIGPWSPIQNSFTTNSAGGAYLGLAGGRAFYRLTGRDLSPTSEGFSNLCAAYGVLRTIAGVGQFSADGYNGWDPTFEGGPGLGAELSRPHMAMADDRGNIYIADKDGQAIRKVSPTGIITTVAGTNETGDDGDSPGPGTERRLSSPNGLWVRGDGTVYILDLGNSKVRRLDPNGVLTTLFHVKSGIDTGRGLWVSPDESLVYYSSGTALRKWTPSGASKTVIDGFIDLGNLVVDPNGDVIVTDRGGNRVYRVSTNGTATVIAGNGELSGGGDGESALSTGLAGVRGVWPVPTGGYLLATHQGSQIWYLDTNGVIHLFLDGSPGAHAGDGDYFRTSGPKVSEIRAVTMDRSGRIIITEHDAGFIRTLEFLPMSR